ncbi:MAG: response regulator [Planctomycetes bacterium]|nr:response regulator [Planctomycetota bacterium]NOG55499.1 response regulator [Planctomycetota bacterium]
MTDTSNNTSSAPSPAQDASFKDAKILIVDDNEQNTELLQAYLDALPCEIQTAGNGIDALEAVQKDQPDLILLDIMMPRMSGYEVCEKLKADRRTKDIPIVMVTALNEVGDVERGVEAGTDEFLSKPFNKLELLTRVRSLLKMRLLKKELEGLTEDPDAECERRQHLDDQTSPGG